MSIGVDVCIRSCKCGMVVLEAFRCTGVSHICDELCGSCPWTSGAAGIEMALNMHGNCLVKQLKPEHLREKATWGKKNKTESTNANEEIEATEHCNTATLSYCTISYCTVSLFQLLYSQLLATLATVLPATLTTLVSGTSATLVSATLTARSGRHRWPYFFWFIVWFPSTISNVLSLFSPNHLSIFFPCHVSSMCRNTPLRSILNTNVIIGLDMCEVSVQKRPVL